MPPGGQSVGLALEDAVLISRILAAVSSSTPISETLSHFVSLRRPRVEDHYKQMASRWEGVKDKPWWKQRIIEFFTWFYLQYLAGKGDANFLYDAEKVEI
jgi:salicylate hydroxylase